MRQEAAGMSALLRVVRQCVDEDRLAAIAAGHSDVVDSR